MRKISYDKLGRRLTGMSGEEHMELYKKQWPTITSTAFGISVIKYLGTIIPFVAFLILCYVLFKLAVES